MGKMGVGAGLRAVCKVADGDPLGGGRIDTASAFNSIIKERETFQNNPPMDSKEYNELGQQGPNRIVGPDVDPWEPPQEPPGGMMRQPGDEDDIGF